MFGSQLFSKVLAKMAESIATITLQQSDHIWRWSRYDKMSHPCKCSLFNFIYILRKNI